LDYAKIKIHGNLLTHTYKYGKILGNRGEFPPFDIFIAKEASVSKQDLPIISAGNFCCLIDSPIYAGD